MQERRKHPRFRLDQRCWCEGECLTLYLRATNVSRGGVFLKTATPLRPGDRASMVWRSPNGDEVVAMAEVVWAAPRGETGDCGMGLRFVSFEKGEQVWDELISLCRVRTPEPA